MRVVGREVAFETEGDRIYRRGTLRMAAMLMAVMAGASREEGAYLPKTGSSSSDRWKVSSYELGSPPGACGQRVVPPIIVPPMIVSILPLARGVV